MPTPENNYWNYVQSIIDGKTQPHRIPGLNNPSTSQEEALEDPKTFKKVNKAINTIATIVLQANDNQTFGICATEVNGKMVRYKFNMSIERI